MTWFSDALRSAHRLSNSISVFRNLWWLLLAVGGGGVVAWRLGRAGGWYLTVGTVLAVLGVVTLAAGIVMMRRASIAPYTWESAEYVYRFDGDDPRRQVQLTKIKIRANRDDVAFFRNRYYWTGQGESRLLPLNGHRVVAERVAMDSQRRYYYVLLDRPLNRGDTAVIQIRQELFDEERTFQPVLAKSLNEPVGRLTLRVIYPAGLEPRHVVARELVRSRNPEADWRTVHERDAEIESTGETTEAIFVANDPRTGRRYALYWGPWGNYTKTT
ncbi:hypothetical protein [Phytohabitans rumicis]|uniref:Uncharacterized protein n=1 Tax=Phytohabitans rumicis TaxID=1076125 RepID=A0A6V8LCB0_9ACTN|nr:hypothetical protein [Phytohabitans rumicis]GFJ90325.1 hypothetical protein Prum_039670 [Phytohabitans rumicis]